ncbi:MAG: DNA alkylation repair protein [Candidatus Aegiribacteria sp.]|nr:DNA alkylation repair protein [Candidatus Aegiribacteria sp.]
MKPNDFAAEFINELETLSDLRTAGMRKLRRKYSKKLIDKDAKYVLEVAHSILSSGKHRWIAYELIHDHPDAFHSLDRRSLEALGRGINSWSSVDCFSRTLSGPAWRDGLISEDTIRDWALSADRWWRRAALVSTVALNMRSFGGKGDAGNTLAICGMLVADHDDMVVKALSWALRALIVHDPAKVEGFLCAYDYVLAARIKREVRNKLETGLKNP